MRAWTALTNKGNPMFWPAVDRALLACTLMIVMNLFFLLVVSLGQLMPWIIPDMNTRVLATLNIFTLVCLIYWFLFYVFSLQIRKRAPESTLPSTLLTHTLGHPLVVLAYFNGVHSITTGLLLAVLPAFGFVMFSNRHVMIALIIIAIEICALALFVSFGWLTDAPLYGDPPPSRFVSPMWVTIQMLIGLPLAIMFLIFTRNIVNALREREAQVREMARRDALTGLWNRGYFSELMAMEILRSERKSYPLSLIIVDLDFFKAINDTHGHAMGDEVLKQSAHKLQNSVRNIDHVGRFGGEEFIVLLPDCPLDKACEIAGRCRQAIAGISLDGINLTASFGVTCGQGKFINGEMLFQQADQALYQAKEQGRDRVVRFVSEDG